MKSYALLAAIVLAAAPAVRAEDKIPADAEITNKLVGKWSAEINEGGATGTEATTFKKDGTFEGVAKVMAGGQKFDMTFAGTWKVEKGQLLSEITKSSAGGPPKGTKSTDTFTAFGDKELKIKDEKGKIETWKREKE